MTQTKAETPRISTKQRVVLSRLSDSEWGGGGIHGLTMRALQRKGLAECHIEVEGRYFRRLWRRTPAGTHVVLRGSHDHQD